MYEIETQNTCGFNTAKKAKSMLDSVSSPRTLEPQVIN